MFVELVTKTMGTVLKSIRSSPKPVHLILSMFGLWLVYTALQAAFLAGVIVEPFASILSLLPGLLGVVILLSENFLQSDLYLRLGGISWIGLALYIAMIVPYWFIIIPTGAYVGWRWADALLYAPIGAISQELFFRAVLLPAFLLIFNGRVWLALICHSILFGLWHIGTIFAGTPIPAALAVMFVPSIYGLAWGWQVMKDRTVLWSILHHGLLLFIMSFYTW
jgi:membrane protease YdiL (CAAX protease family)